jgi:MinD-like ATPase involved in chromosome partitioning or flagellar assembly
MIVLTSGKGSPGATTAAVALAATSPAPALVVECDPGGSDLGLRMRDLDGRFLPADAGLLAWAAAPAEPSPVDVAVFAHPTSAGVDVLLGPPAAVHAAALGPVWRAAADSLARLDGRVFVDVGRLAPDGPQWLMMAAADLVIVVCRATADSVLHTRATLQLLGRTLSAQGSSADVSVVVIADPRETDAAGQVRDALAVDGVPDCVLGALPLDPHAAALLAGELSPRQRIRSPLLRAAAGLTEAIDAQLASRAETTVPSGVEPVEPTAADSVAVTA